MEGLLSQLIIKAYKMSEYSEKCPSQYPNFQGDAIKFPVLSDQQGKAANPQNFEAGTRECHFCLKITF